MIKIKVKGGILKSIKQTLTDTHTLIHVFADVLDIGKGRRFQSI